MRDAEHGKDGAPVALEVSLTLFPAWLQSVPLQRGAPPPITILVATFASAASFLSLGRAAFAEARIFRHGRVGPAGGLKPADI